MQGSLEEKVRWHVKASAGPIKWSGSLSNAQGVSTPPDPPSRGRLFFAELWRWLPTLTKWAAHLPDVMNLDVLLLGRDPVFKSGG